MTKPKMSASSERKRRRRPTFRSGDEVEVRPDGSGFRGAWYEARIHRFRPERGRCAVVYDSLADASDQSRPLRETVAAKNVRLRPPPLEDGERRFHLEQVVDARYNDGWLRGVVSRVPGEGGEGRYGVRFPLMNEEELEFGASELRFHINGKWVHPRDQDKLKSPRQGEEQTGKVPHKFKILTAGDDDAISKTNNKCLDSEMSSDESGIRNQIDSSLPCKKPRKGEAIEDDMRLIDCLAGSTNAFSRMKTGLKVNMLATDKTPTFHLKTFLNDNFCCSAGPLIESSAQSLNFVLETSPTALSKELHNKTCTPANFTPGPVSSNLSLSIIEPPSQRGEELVMQGVVQSENQLKVHCSSSVSNQGQYGSASCPMENDQQKQLLVTLDQQGEVPHNSNVENLVTGKRRKRNVPRKVRVTDTKVSSEGNVRRQFYCNYSSISTSSLGEIHHRRVWPMEEPKISSELKQTICGNNGNNERNLDSETSVTVDSESISREVQFVEGHSIAQTEAATCHKDPEGQVLFDKIRSPSCRILPGTPNLHSEHNLAGSKSRSEHNVVGSRTPSVISTPRVSVSRASISHTSGKLCPQDWPFEKRSPVWEFVESMEIVPKMLQHPHFRPLEQHPEALREGFAAGLFVTYANLVDSIGKLKIADSDKTFDEKKHTIAILEGHGFDVQHLHACMDELLRISNTGVQLRNKVSALKLQIEEEQRKDGDLDTKNKAIDEEIDDLEQKLSKFRERKTSIVKLKEECDADIVKLQMDVRIVDERCKSAESEFGSIVAADW